MSYVQRILSLNWNCISQTNSRLCRSLNLKMDEKSDTYVLLLVICRIIMWLNERVRWTMGRRFKGRGRGDCLRPEYRRVAMENRSPRQEGRSEWDQLCSISLYLSLYLLYVNRLTGDWVHLRTSFLPRLCSVWVVWFFSHSSFWRWLSRKKVCSSKWMIFLLAQ